MVTEGHRILMVAPSMPARRGNGLAMRLGIFLEALSMNGRVDLVIVPVFDPAPGNLSWLGRSNVAVHVMERQPETELSLLLRITDDAQRLDAFIRYARPTLAGQFMPSAWSSLARNLGTPHYDLVHVSRAYMLNAIDAFPDRTISLDLDEDDLSSFASSSLISERCGRSFEAAWLKQEGAACDRMISKSLRRIHTAFAANAVDVAALRLRHPGLPLQVLRNAVDLPAQVRKRPTLLLLFVGTLSYGPNLQGLLWFIHRVLPQVQERVQCHFLVIGRGASSELRRALVRSGTDLKENVEDLAPYYRRAAAVVAPIHAGGGTRIKLLEAAAFGVPSIATSTACSGLFEWNRPWGWVADEPQPFALACVEALTNSIEAARRGQEGKAQVTRHYSRTTVLSRLTQQFQELLHAGSSKQFVHTGR